MSTSGKLLRRYDDDSWTLTLKLAFRAYRWKPRGRTLVLETSFGELRVHVMGWRVRFGR